MNVYLFLKLKNPLYLNKKIMSDHYAPHDVKSFTLTAFISFVVVFVFANVDDALAWQLNHDADGKIHYGTRGCRTN